MDENEKNVNVETETTENAEKQTEMSPADFEAEMAKLIAENKRLRAATDKATADASKWKKKFTDTQSESERLSMEKAEREADIQNELAELRKESAVNKFTRSFMAIGYTEDMAVKAAEAQFAGDTDELFRIQKTHQDELAKQIRADIMKTMPAPSTGNDDSVQMTKEQFDKLSYREQVKLKIDHPTVYNKLATQ